MALSRLQQLCIAAEDVEGTVISSPALFSAGNAKYLAIDPQMTFEVETYQRDVSRETFTPLSPLAGAVLGSASFSLEMNAKVTSSITAIPQWDIPLLACGFRRERLIRLTFGAGTTAQITHGSTITATGTATVIGNYLTGSTSVWCTKGTNNNLGNSTGMANVGATVGGSSVGTVTANATDAGMGWWPTSVSLYTITTTGSIAVALNANDVIVGNVSGAIGILYYGQSTTTGAVALYVRRIQGTFTSSDTNCTVYRDGSVVASTTVAVSTFKQSFDTNSVKNISPAISIGLSKDGVRESLKGARGSVSISGNVGEPVLLNFNFQGIKNEVLDSGAVSSVTYDDDTPPVLLGSSMVVSDGGITATTGVKAICATSFNLDMANDIQYRRCINAATGIDGIYFNGRSPNGTVDPDQSPELDFDWMNNYFTSGNIRLDVTVGSTAPDKFRVNTLNSSVTSVGQGDRNGLITRDIAFAMHSGSSSSVGGDNEFVIIWDLTT